MNNELCFSYTYRGQNNKKSMQKDFTEVMKIKYQPNKFLMVAL